MAGERRRTTPGPKSVAVADLRNKLDGLLLAHGRLHLWLAKALDTSASVIANWKAESKIPIHQLLALCAQFELDRKFFIESDRQAFDAYLDRFLTLGSGQSWRALLNRCDEQAAGLSFFAPPALTPFPVRRLRGVRADRMQPESPKRVEFFRSDCPTFEVDPAKLPGIHAWSEANVLLVLKDPERTQCLCPSADRGNFVLTEGKWRFPGPTRRQIEFDGLIGPHQAIAIVHVEPLPVGIREALLSDHVVGDPKHLLPALDRIAIWLRGDLRRQNPEVSIEVAHTVRSLRFLLLPERPPTAAARVPR